MTTQECINLVKGIDLTYPLSYEIIFQFFCGTALTIYDVPLRKNSLLYRARLNEGREFFDSLSDVSYPPYTNKFSRANRPLQSVFYCSQFEETTCYELLASWNSKWLDGEIIIITMGQWELLEDLRVIIIPDFNKQNNLMLSALEKIGEKRIGMTEDDEQFYRFINTQFKENASKKESVYRLTSAFCNSHLVRCKTQGFSCDGIVYTSVKNGKDVNLALSPTVIDSGKLRLRKVKKTHYKVTRPSGGEILASNMGTPFQEATIDFENKRLIWAI